MEQKHICPVCGKELVPNYRGKYATYCSSACVSRGTRNKAHKTMLDKYGKVGYNNRNKAAETIQERYGDTYHDKISNSVKKTIQERYGNEYGKVISNKAQETMKRRYGGGPLLAPGALEKMRKTMEERYGCINYYNTERARQTRLEKNGVFRSQEEIEKFKITMMKRYGAMRTQEMTDKIKESRRQRTMDEKEFLEGYTEDGQWICKCPHPECNKCEEKTFITPLQIQYLRVQGGYETCTKLLPINDHRSTGETIICGWLDEWGIEYETSNRTELDGQELDIYIPSIKVAIEFNGCFWHSTKFKHKNYHQKKFELCQSKGIHLIQIWEDWLRNKEDIVKSFISSKVGVCNKSIYARKCEIRNVSSKSASHFYNENHIQGKCHASIHYGLYYEDVLVACMSFSKRSKLSGSKERNDNEMELIRFCNLKNMRVIGAAGRLLKHFIKNNSVKIITSYSCNDISDGGLYKSLGFERFGNINSSYWYVEDVSFTRYHRSTFAKSGIVKRGWKDKIDNTWTEREVMDTKPYFRIYDAGTTGWRLYV